MHAGGGGKGAESAAQTRKPGGSAVGAGDRARPECGVLVFGSKPVGLRCDADTGGRKVEEPRCCNKGAATGHGDRAPPGRFSEHLWEAPRVRTGLQLIGEMASQNGQMGWQYPLLDESRRSYCGFWKSSFTPDQTRMFYRMVHDGTNWLQPMGPRGPIPRKTAWMTSDPCTCAYRYGSIEVPATPYTPWMLQIMKVVMPLCGLPNPQLWPTSCNLNLYQDGGHAVGWHTDDEKLFQGKFQDMRIISLSLGAARWFEVRANWPEEGEQSFKKVRLADGDLATMEGMFQKHYLHRVPKEGRVQGGRINLTWRWVVKHNPQCAASRRR